MYDINEIQLVVPLGSTQQAQSVPTSLLKFPDHTLILTVFLYFTTNDWLFLRNTKSTDYHFQGNCWLSVFP